MWTNIQQEFQTKGFIQQTEPLKTMKIIVKSLIFKQKVLVFLFFWCLHNYARVKCMESENSRKYPDINKLFEK